MSLSHLPDPITEPVNLIPPPTEWWLQQYRNVVAELPPVAPKRWRSTKVSVVGDVTVHDAPWLVHVRDENARVKHRACRRGIGRGKRR